jgi:homoaconitase/3-isopropylmalate dehydratase large subunit
VPITKAFINFCIRGKLDEFTEATSVLCDRQVAKGVNLFIVPASREISQKAQN